MEQEARVSELIVLAFRDQYRAAEVLNDLKRREWEWVRDLDDAVAIAMGPDGRARVQLSVDLSNGEAAGWARLWGSLLSVTLFRPTVGVMVDAANGVSAAVRANGSHENRTTLPDGKWWRDCLHISESFVRDVAAVVKPGGSAIFMLLRIQNVPIALEQLRNYSNTLLHTSLTVEQEKEMNAVLTVG